MKMVQSMGTFMLTIFASFILVILGTIYFMVTIWIIKLGSSWAGATVDGNMMVLAAAIVTAASMIGSAMQK